MKSPHASAPRRSLGLPLGVLAVSLIANAALVSSLRRPSATVAVPPTTVEEAAPVESSAPPPPTPAPVVDPELWSQLEAEEPQELIGKLRAAGFDETLVRAIVWSRLARRAHIDEEAINDAPYWRRNAVRMQFYRQRSNERRAGQQPTDITEFEALFGEKPTNLFGPSAGDVFAARQGLSNATTAIVNELRRARDAQVGPTSGGRYVNGKPDEATQLRLDRQAEANALFDAQLRAQLTPAEYDTYLRQASDTANFLRTRTGAMGLSQAEFDGIANVLGPATVGFRPDLSAHEAALTALLGEERYAEFTQAATGDTQTNRIVERLGLPISTAVALQGIRDDITQRAQTLSRNRDLSREEKDAQNAALAAEATQRIAATLPPEGVELYNNYAGLWMTRFNPPPPTPPTGP